MASRSALIQKWHRDAEACARARKRHRGQWRAGKALKETTLALLKHEIGQRQIAPARAGKAARASTDNPSLFEGI